MPEQRSLHTEEWRGTTELRREVSKNTYSGLPLQWRPTTLTFFDVSCASMLDTCRKRQWAMGWQPSTTTGRFGWEWLLLVTRSFYPRCRLVGGRSRSGIERLSTPFTWGWTVAKYWYPIPLSHCRATFRIESIVLYVVLNFKKKLPLCLECLQFKIWVGPNPSIPPRLQGGASCVASWNKYQLHFTG